MLNRDPFNLRRYVQVAIEFCNPATQRWSLKADHAVERDCFYSHFLHNP
jgi:hypothetical protein